MWRSRSLAICMCLYLITIFAVLVVLHHCYCCHRCSPRLLPLPLRAQRMRRSCSCAAFIYTTYVCQYIAVLSIYSGHVWAAHQYQLHVAVQARAADWIFNISISPSYILDCAGGKVTSELTTSEAREGWPFPPEPRKLSRYSLESDLLCRQLIIGG